jgi:hypothetical protein
MNESRINTPGFENWQQRKTERIEWPSDKLQQFRELTTFNKIERVRKGEIPHNSLGIFEVTFKDNVTQEEFFKFYSQLLKNPTLRQRGMGSEDCALWEYKNSPDFSKLVYMELDSKLDLMQHPQDFHHDGNRNVFYHPKLAVGKVHSRFAPTVFVDEAWWTAAVLDEWSEVSPKDPQLEQFLHSERPINWDAVLRAVNNHNKSDVKQLIQQLGLKAVINGDVYEHFWEEGDLVDFGKYYELLHGQGLTPKELTEETIEKEQPLGAFDWKRSFLDKVNELDS